VKNMATDPMVDEGLAVAVRAALEADDPEATLETNLRRMAKAIADGRVYNTQGPAWKKVFAGAEIADGGGQCGCGDVKPEEIDLSSLLGMDDHEFVAATAGRRWEKLMR
jgi:hypothetical protein